MSKSTVIVTFQSKPGQGEALGQALSKAIEHTITLPGCYKAVLVSDDDNPERFVMVEEWDAAQSHKDYAAGLMKDPKMEKLMGLLQAPPDSRYYSDHTLGGGAWGGPGHLEISSNDPSATRSFLTDVFDWRFTTMMEGYDGFWAPGALMGGLRPKMEEEAAPQTIPYLIVDDLYARLERVEAAGGQIIVPIQEVPQAGRFFWFVAPGGLTLAAWESAKR